MTFFHAIHFLTLKIVVTWFPLLKKNAPMSSATTSVNLSWTLRYLYSSPACRVAVTSCSAAAHVGTANVAFVATANRSMIHLQALPVRKTRVILNLQVTMKPWPNARPKQSTQMVPKSFVPRCWAGMGPQLLVPRTFVRTTIIVMFRFIYFIVIRST